VNDIVNITAMAVFEAQQRTPGGARKGDPAPVQIKEFHTSTIKA